MKSNIKRTKTELKELAQQIKTKRKAFKQAQRDSDWKALWKNDPSGDARTYRHKHIAYCLARGRTMEQIERSCKPGNEPSENLIEQFLKEINDEAVRDSEVGPVEVAASSSGGTCASPAATLGTCQEDGEVLEQSDAHLPEGKGPGLVDRIKSLFG